MTMQPVYNDQTIPDPEDDRRTSLSLRWSELYLLAHCVRVVSDDPEATSDQAKRQAIDVLRARLDNRTSENLQIQAPDLFQLALVPGEIFASAQAVYEVTAAAKRFFKKWARKQAISPEEFVAAAINLMEAMYSFSPPKIPNRFAREGSIFEAEWRDGPWTYRATTGGTDPIRVERVTAD